jgi:aspartyl-tRNA(Asn)/glutamyl-tRNA(Gln) amidotransferase subunit A
LRLAYSRTLGYLTVDPEVATLVDRAVARFAELGAIVEDTDPGFENPGPIHQVLWAVGAAKLLRGIPAEHHALIEAGLRQTAERGQAITVPEYLEALDRRMELGMHQLSYGFHHPPPVPYPSQMPASTQGTGSQTGGVGSAADEGRRERGVATRRGVP